MSTIHVVGGERLDGSIEVHGSKNAALPILAATLLTEGVNVIENCPQIKDVAEMKPNVVFVAMGAPKQELLMEEMSAVHSAIYQGLGGSFDVYTGNVKRAPKWWVEHNLEFAYRLIKQPSRIKRQIHLLRFLMLAKWGKL